MKDLKQMELKISTSSPGDIPANRSVLQDVKRVNKMKDTSGQSILGLSKNVGRLSLLEKMLVDTLNSVSTPYLRTWRVKVTPQQRLVFQLRASAPTTNGKGYGLLPTPTTSDGTTGSIIGKDDKFRITKNGTLRKVNKNGIDGSIGLGRLVKLWRTPDANCGRGPSSKERMQMKLDKKMPISLNDQVAHPNLMWPTPRAAVGMNMRLTENMAKLRHKRYLETEVAYQEKGSGGQLNPTWVEWLMGYPKGWTDLNA